ncbi:restriction endonuclease subunit S [Phascolarctobacterium succinatutens]|uniref:restriction endonuclease subunit S n=1 Tax=Phascolarctobacterium succinatutens TaxID=626940 RepID=UPI00307A68EC
MPAEEQPYEVPENWVWVRLGAVCFFENGYAFKSDKFSSEKGIPVIRISNIKENNVDLDDCIKTLEENIDEKYIVHQGDLLIAMSGATTGKNGVYMSANIAYLNQRVGNIKVKNKELLIEKFRNFYIANMQNEILNTAYGGAQPNISSQKMSVMTFPLPPLSEQQRIVERIEELFAKLDEAKERLQEVANSFAVRKAAILHKAFTGELTKQWRRENGVSDESWEEKKLGEVCSVNPRKIDAKNLDDNLEVSFIPMAAVSDVLGEIVNPEVKNLEDVRTGFTNFAEGDVIFAKITPCMENGKSAVVGPLLNDIGYGSTEFYVLRCKEELYNKYLYHMVRNTTFRAEAKAVMTGAVGQQRVPKTFLQEYQLLLPTIPEQHEIVRLIDDLLARERSAQQAAEQALASIDLMKKSILARAFRGELGTNKASEASALELLRQVLAEN